MQSFDLWMNNYQTEWRKTHVASTELGSWRGRGYPWILPADLWEEALWPGIRKGSDNSVADYLEKNRVQKHLDVHNLKSSWTLCVNLYFPFRASAYGLELFASFLRRHVAPEIASLEGIELEYAEDGELHPSSLLGETGGKRGANQTSPDLGLLVNGGRGLVLLENKLMEHSFYGCSAWRRKSNYRRSGNPDPDRCNHPLEVAKDPANQCHQAAWGRRYWEHLASVIDEKAVAALPHCPAARHGYQLFRQQALAEGIAQSGKYDLVVSAVAVDERNDLLAAALNRGGISEWKQWREIFRGAARFAVFTHQQWVKWVREHDIEGQWSDWLSYVHARYDLS